MQIVSNSAITWRRTSALSDVSSFYVSEPDLIFANKSRFKDPRGGLYLFGPYGQYGNASYVKITTNAGIIGTSKSISKVVNFFDYLHRKIPASGQTNVDFPGLGLDGKLRHDIRFDSQWEQTIDKSNMDECERKTDRIQRTEYLLKMIEDKLEAIHGVQPNPDVVFVSLPSETLKLCIVPGQKGLKITLANKRFRAELSNEQKAGDFDFHDIIKVLGMKYRLPTQFILPTTLDLDRKTLQDLATRAWNLTVAIYYKTRGVPWKLAELEPDTCYAGVSFYRECSPDGQQFMRAGVARVFLATGEALVLKGDPFKWNDPHAEPHLNEEQAVALMDKIIAEYKKSHKDKPPQRLVLHKTSEYTSEEKVGFLKACETIPQKDLLTVTRSKIDWYREGSYPTVRGNVFKVSGTEFYIFTLGYIPQLKTFPKPGIPVPIRVQVANLDSPDRLMCKEILALTRLNWNNADFCDQMPITISASRRIGSILSEARAREIEISNEYKFYM